MKKNHAVYAGIGVILAALAALCFYRLNIALSAATTPHAAQVIVLDPGHGGFDGGAVSKNNIVEKDINLSISLKCRELFKAMGFRVVMTRETDTAINDADITGTKKKKTSDMHNRLKIVEANPTALFLSIHQNKFQESKYHGAQIFYSPNNPESERLAKKMQESFREMLQPENTREYKRAGKELYLLYKAKCPAVMAECGFLSNPEEAEKLNNQEYQDKVAFTIVKSVMEYLADSKAGA